MDPQQIAAQGREMMIKELNIAHLPEEAQSEILDGLGEVLLRRVLLKLLELLPETERANFGKLLETSDGQAAQELIQKYIPNSPDVIRDELRAGIDEHKRLVNARVEKDTASVK